MRLFVAIRPPRAVREQILALMGGVAGARWQSDDQLHITLRFIGEVDRRQMEDVAASLYAIRYSPFEIRLDGLGSFERRGQAASLWIGLAPQEPLKELHQKVDHACVRAGLEPERRAYHPHITLARLGRSAGSVETAVTQSGGVTSDPFKVDSFGLFESVLTPEGAVYSLVERYLPA